jgi:hypothetical protein
LVLSIERTKRLIDDEQVGILILGEPHPEGKREHKLLHTRPGLDVPIVYHDLDALIEPEPDLELIDVRYELVYLILELR